MDQERIASLYLYEPIQHTLSYLNKIIFIYWYICIHFILQSQLLINILRSKSKLKMLFIPRFENLMTSIKNLSRRQKFPIFIKSDLYSRSFKLLFGRLQVEHFEKNQSNKYFMFWFISMGVFTLNQTEIFKK